MDYYDWKPVGVASAQKALNKGGTLMKLPVQFGSFMARYTYGLVTPRGTCYLVSDRTLAALAVPDSAWPAPPARAANHRSPFGPFA